MRNVTQDAKIDSVPVRTIESDARLYKYNGSLNKRIAAREFEIFERSGRVHGHDVDDWLKAESEVVWELH